ncbi:CDP-6-deoxy-delta-3,4-glucoseen reductase [Leeia sp. TBRC 13508]|uniref:CDP-6-deoxy-delta-3,4-glucoseen reductase n=1 Tax=Leeia speluncae TaxID=2884804 RepID=A0ABS8D6S3_9NEIS|nr:CDP-6-deoxy-delta-3,4-glucoseen reductase [Leeia speluncae]MCB6183852.1 CDP-6-deoxy-delta-3,4-glucoseen reductase [Leeia speluncae]
MSCQVKLTPSGHEFNAKPEDTLLESAMQAGLNIPYGCRNGACGACKATIVTGEVRHGDFQSTTLTADEIAAGKTLLCCAYPETDLTIEVKEVTGGKDIPVKTLPCRVHKIEKPADDVAVLYLKLPASERLQFMAGQYIDILMKDGKRRSFSLANAPHDDEFLQLHIRHVPGGSFSDYVFTGMKEKEILRFNGPLGTFFLREDSDKPMILIASGTGFAPIKGIVEHALKEGCDRQMVFYWGARQPKDLYMFDLALKWQQENPNFTFIPVVSDATADDNWAGRTGFVHQAVLDDFADLSGYQVYACGAPVVVEAAHNSFIQTRNLPEDEFYSDAFFLAKDLKP